MSFDFDAVIVGAGAAGLSAARTLCRSGRSVLIVEARDRIGGRVLTLTDARCAAPIELGGEFIHGTPESTLALLRETGAAAIGESGTSWRYDGTRLHAAGDSFESVAALMDKVDTAGPDESVDSFLRRFEGDAHFREACEWTRILVEGFDAADPAVASIQAIAQEWSGDASLQTTQLRPSRGYAPLLESLAASLPPERARLMLQSPVRDIAWGRGGVTLRAVQIDREVEVRAKCAIVTVPAGVLASSGIAFTPELPFATREAIGAIAMGPVVKIALRFGTPFWRELQNGRFADASFFFGGATAFPTFWNMFPIVSPLLIGWAAGPRAARFDPMSQPQIAAQALAAVAAIFDVPASDLARNLEAYHLHDWQRDRWSLGAYSYVKTGGMRAREALAAPLEDALVFAGEATAPGGEAGTVAGALASGTRAAHLIAG